MRKRQLPQWKAAHRFVANMVGFLTLGSHILFERNCDVQARFGGLDD